MKLKHLLETGNTEDTNGKRNRASIKNREQSLTYIIAKGKWEKVHEKLLSSPEEASTPIPTGTNSLVYSLHQAVCNKVKPVPENALLLIIQAFPKALDLNVFIGACENSRFSRGSMELLLDQSNPKIYQALEADPFPCIHRAVKRNNKDIVEIFIERFPSILKSDILPFSCEHGTAIIVEKILLAGIQHDVDHGGGLFRTNNEKQDALDVAIKRYDEEDYEKRNILIKCIQYANARKLGNKIPDPNYSIILAAIGIVPKRILASLLKEYAHEIRNINAAGKQAIMKAIKISESVYDDGAKVPSIFESSILKDACSNGNIELVQQILEESTRKSIDDIHKEHTVRLCSNTSMKNALEISLDLLDETNDTRCQILKSLIQHANAEKLGKKIELPNYPTLLAAAGIVPPQYLLGIGKAFKNELRVFDSTGKMTLKKVLKMAEDLTKYAGHLDKRGQYPLSDTTIFKRSRRGSLRSIPSFEIIP